MINIDKLDQNGDVISQHKFDFVEDGQAWAEQDAKEEIEWEQARKNTLEGLTKAGQDYQAETGEYPPVWYLISGWSADEYDELADEDWRDQTSGFED